MSRPPSYPSAISTHPRNQMTTLPQYEPSRQLPQDVQNNERYISPSSSPDENGKRPLDLVQRLERKLAGYNASQNVFKRWLFELASWLISALCMGTVIGIYITISGQEMTKSEQYLTISNTLGKIASAALIVPTTEALGQLKWNWFHKSNAMWDFEIFDKASRGAWGATLLLFRTKGRSLAALGKLWPYELHVINTLTSYLYFCRSPTDCATACYRHFLSASGDIPGSLGPANGIKLHSNRQDVQSAYCQNIHEGFRTGLDR